VKKILAASIGHRLHALFVLAVWTGAREGELLALQWADIDFEAKTVAIRKSLAQVKGGPRVKDTKSERGRRILALPDACIVALKTHHAAMKEAGLLKAPVFCTSTGQYIGKSNFVRQVHRPLLVKVEVTYRKFHTFRHTHASELLRQGTPVLEVAKRLGDTPEVVMKTYAHYMPSTGSRIGEKLAALYG
jgi:integrase